jgi:hypothetical protein
MNLNIKAIEKEIDTTYPCMKKNLNTGAIILFTEPRTGVILDPGNSVNSIGTNNNCWLEENFKIPIRSITIYEA